MKRCHILYVDDDPDIRTIVSVALALDPEIVLTMASGADEALDKLAGGLSPDVAVLDVMMPGIDGTMLLATLRADAATAGLPVIFLTGRGRLDDRSRYALSDAIGVIVKPFDPLALGGEIRRLLSGRRGSP